MRTNTHPMACGGCGNGLFRVFTLSDDQCLFAECTACKSVSAIRPQARLVIDWEPKSEGVLAPMEPTKFEHDEAPERNPTTG